MSSENEPSTVLKSGLQSASRRSDKVPLSLEASY